MPNPKDVRHVSFNDFIMEPLKVYLAGSLNSDWQSQIINRFGNDFIFYNPKDHELNNSIEYTVWDLFYVKKADILFAFMEKDNPSGFGLTLEVGYAKAMGLTIILVDEKSNIDLAFKENFKIVRSTATVVYNSLEDGMEFLSSFLRTNKTNQHALT